MLLRPRLFVLFVVLFFCPLGTVFAELGFRAGPEEFRWREYNSGGARLLEESGQRYRLGVDWRRRFSSDPQLFVEISGSFYLGNVDYDGQACTLSGACVPYRSETRYIGEHGEATLLRRFGGRAGALMVFGVGVDHWERQIRGDNTVSGVVEEWTLIYLLGGSGAHWNAANARFNLRAGLKLPFYTAETTDSVATVTLRPKGRLSPFTKLTVDFGSKDDPRWGLGVYYDSYRFDESDRERTGSIIIWQPESHQDVIGVYGTIYLR